MQNVICDTNVWYRIGDGTFSPPSNIKLVPTELSIYELVTSPVIASNPELVQKAVKAIYDHGGAVIPVNPLTFFYVIKMIVSNGIVK